MKGLKTKNFMFLMLTVIICIGFGSFTLFNQFKQPSKFYVENVSEENTESDVKSSEKLIDFYLNEPSLLISLDFSTSLIENLVTAKFTLPAFCASPNTPPPDLN